MIHGMGNHSGWFDRAGKRLADQGLRVYAFDQRGHGRTLKRGGHKGYIEGGLRNSLRHARWMAEVDGSDVPKFLAVVLCRLERAWEV